MTPAGPVLHLVRHGETAWNAEGRMQGSVDVPLNAVGRGQAAAAAAELADRPVGTVIASDLSRARETAETIAEPHGLGLTLEPALRERNFGVVEGRLYLEARAEYGDERWDLLLHGNDDHFAGGESTRQHYERVAAFMDRLLADPPAPEIVLVSHGGTVRRIRSYLRGGFEREDWAPVVNGAVLTLRA